MVFVLGLSQLVGRIKVFVQFIHEFEDGNLAAGQRFLQQFRIARLGKRTAVRLGHLSQAMYAPEKLLRFRLLPELDILAPDFGRRNGCFGTAQPAFRVPQRDGNAHGNALQVLAERLFAHVAYGQ